VLEITSINSIRCVRKPYQSVAQKIQILYIRHNIYLLYMANTYHQVYIQAVFAVKYREALLHKDWRKDVFAVIGHLINETGCKTIIVNGVEDHVHCFLGLKPTVSISELMKTVKAKSSKYINDNKLIVNRFEWQEGYGVFSYSHSNIDAVYKYITNQEEHHKKENFKNEYLKQLDSFTIPYEERYTFEDLK
jgi:putative transposase